MKIELVRDLAVVSRFIYWIKERESIRLAKDRGDSKPWTDDEILQSYRFCNVRRMDDKVSQWLLRNWYEPYRNHESAVLACALARFINLPDSLTEVGYPGRWEPERIKTVLRKRKADGYQVYNGAYMIRADGKVDKATTVVDRYVSQLVQFPRPKRPTLWTMQDVWEALLPLYGFGSFMAGQVVADLRWHIDGEWADRNDWAPMGPGSKRGLNRIIGFRIDAPLSQPDFLKELRVLRSRCEKKLPGSISDRLEMMDWQNCLCEFDKYERTLFDNRRPKAKYPGVK